MNSGNRKKGHPGLVLAAKATDLATTNTADAQMSAFADLTPQSVERTLADARRHRVEDNERLRRSTDAGRRLEEIRKAVKAHSDLSDRDATLLGREIQAVHDAWTHNKLDDIEARIDKLERLVDEILGV